MIKDFHVSSTTEDALPLLLYLAPREVECLSFEFHTSTSSTKQHLLVYKALDYILENVRCIHPVQIHSYK